MPDLDIVLPTLHPAQSQILAESKRFNVLKCGRRFGKTELTKELAIQPMLDSFPVGYWCPTYKDLHEVWNELKFTLHPIIKSKDEQVKQIQLITGGKIDFWSLDDPNSGRGRKYKRAIVDEAEKARHLKDAWEQTIRATLVDYSGDAWFMSTPKFGQTYFKEIFKNKEKYEDWMSWRYTTFDNPYIPKEEIEAARAQLDDLTFKCEFLAEDVDITNNPFAYAFSFDRHVGKDEIEYQSQHELRLSMDYNVDPLVCISSQYVDGQIRILKEFRLQNSDIYEMCDRIKAAYPHALFLVTGDATGRARQAISKGNITYYQVIKQRLNLTDLQIRVPGVNPAVSDTRVLINSILQNLNLIINPSCKYLIDDLKYVEVDENGDIDKSQDKHRSHLTDAFRYLCWTFHKNFIKMLN